MLDSMLEDASAETSERVIAVLGSRLESMTRLVVGLHLEPSIRGDRRVRSKMESAKCLDDVVSAVVPDSRVGADSPLDVAVLRASKFMLLRRLKLRLNVACQGDFSPGKCCRRDIFDYEGASGNPSSTSDLS
ncbi:unnamed protein product [Phytophthora fragariaefolia]|uniref:Unnamed protein product n=1 Tax=Phytophthora fragariaefolia TaxID=1490495 RepID=A0A9W7D1X8_9STRA|nr:unnamed protein product [Phytophthora fragariaefolia]